MLLDAAYLDDKSIKKCIMEPMKKTFVIDSTEEMLAFGKQIGSRLQGGEVFELAGDVGTGKTSFVKGLALGMGIGEVVQSPSFTISRVYDAPKGRLLRHYDFYRLSEPGIMRDELAEALASKTDITAIEWDDTVSDLLPADRTLCLRLAYAGEMVRQVELTLPKSLLYIVEGVHA